MDTKRMYRYFAFQSARDMFSAIEYMWKRDDEMKSKRTRFAMVGSGDIHQCRIDTDDATMREVDFVTEVLMRRTSPFAITTTRSEEWDDVYSKLIGIDHEPQILVELKD